MQKLKKMTQVAQRNNHVLQMLKRLRETLDNDKKKYAEKVNVLVMTWERIAASAKEQRPLAAICIVEKMYKDTLSIMLQGEWPKMSPVSKTHLIQMLHRCRTDLCKEMPWLNRKFRKLLELVNDPWTLPSLERILHKDPSPATPEQIVEFCESERGLLIVTRLTMLCSNRCEKVAIKLAEACFGALSSGNATLMSYFTTNEYNFIFDIYLCLLYKYKKLECIINALKTVSITNGYYLVVRLRKRSHMHEQKIWKFSHQVAAVASRYFVTVSMLSRTIPNSTLLKNLVSDWLSMCNPGENNVENEVRKVMQPAETSEHIYIMAEVLTLISQKLGNQMYSSLIMELYIRALTADINYLERVKLQNDKEQMTAYEKHLASKFLALADLVKDHSGVRREFVLTAFSIHPSAEIYRRVEEEAVASGKASPHSASQESIEVGVLSEGLSSLSSEETEGKETTTDYSVNNDSQDSGAFVEISNRCPLHLPYDGIGPEGELCFQCGDFTGTQTPTQTPTDQQQQKKKERSLDALILIKGNTVTESLNYDVLSAPSQVLEAEKLGLTSQVCADLVTLLGSNRYHLLTWVLEWGELSSRCLRYMDEADTIKSGKKELKFLEIDYNQYKDWPENDDEADCIEKGYEQWLEDDNTETDFDTDSKRSNTDDSEELMIKTAIRRSQKQVGRYAESSSDSEDSRSRPRSKKRGRPRKRLKSYSDSGSVSDSLGSDGQKQKSSSKKRTKSKDLRKTLGRLKVLEMTNESNNLSPPDTNCFTPDVVPGKIYGLPTSGNNIRGDQTVLKTLRAFRPNAHKTKNDDAFMQSVTESCYNSKTVGGPKVSNRKATVFDCNDNKFITTQGDRFSFGGKDMELHFRTGGVRTKKYNDVIRTIKEDLISVSNIPSVTNNATVNVVHVHETQPVTESSQDVQSTTSTTTVAAVVTTATTTTAAVAVATTTATTTAVSTTARNATSAPKTKADTESQGSQVRKSTSSQLLGQNAVVSYYSSPVTTGTATILTSALTRVNPVTRPGGTFVTTNQLLTTAGAGRSGATKTIGQPQYMAIVNRSSLSQSGAVTGQVQALEGQTVSNSVVGFVTSNSVKGSGQNFVSQGPRGSVQAARVVAVSAADTARFVLETDRPNVISGKSFGVQSVRVGSPATFNHVSRGLNNGSTQAKKSDEGTANASGSETTSAMAPATSQSGPNSRLTFSDASANSTKGSNSKPGDFQKTSNEAAVAVVSGPNATFMATSKSNSQRLSATEAEGQLSNRSTTTPARPPVNVLTNQSSQGVQRGHVSKAPHTVILQTTVPIAGRGSLPLGESSGPKRTVQLAKVSTSGPGESSEDPASRSGLINSVTGTSPLTLEVRNAVGSTTTATTSSSGGTVTFGSRNYGQANKAPYSEVVRIVQGMTPGSSLDASELTASPAGPPTSAGDSGDVIAIIDSSSGAKLDTSTVVPARNILATVLKRNSVGNLLSATSQYSVPGSRNPVDVGNQGDGVQNVMISQSSNSSTIHYTVVNPLQHDVQQQQQQEALTSVAGDVVVKANNYTGSQSVIPSLLSHVDNSEFTGEGPGTAVPGPTVPSDSDVKKVTKTSSSPGTVHAESGGFIKKQVLNNQKITILVQNNSDGDRDKSEGQSKNKLNELLFRDDQKTCITFRAIKRTQSDGCGGESSSSSSSSSASLSTTTSSCSAAKKKCPGDLSGGQNGDATNDPVKSSEETESDVRGDTGSSESLCQYLVLEAINDPAGALPKFNQAFGKSYQVKIPQAIKLADTSDTGGGGTGGGEGLFGGGSGGGGVVVVDQAKSDTKLSGDPRPTSLTVLNQVPVTTETPRELNTFEIVQKPVKSVYIDKEVKLMNVQQSVKAAAASAASEGAAGGALGEPANISTIQMTEVQQQHQQPQQPQQQQQQQQPPQQQPGLANAYQAVPKVARSSVVQQLLRKVPTTGPPTLQAVNSVNTVTAKQLKAQDVVSGSTLIYATETRAQSQIVIQRAVGRVNTPGISQVAPVIYTQNPGDHASPQTQTLLLAAVPTGTRGVAPGTQLLRIPSSSGVWKMTSSVNPPKIVQIRPQNLVLQGGQDQSLLMQGGQPVLLHHLTSLPIKPIGVVANSAKTDPSPKMDVKNDVGLDDPKLCSVPLDVDQSSIKSETSSPAATVSEHETVSLMKDIKEFENVFEETKLKFEMEEQQGVCLPEVETVPQPKASLATVNVQPGPGSSAVHQTVLVQPQLMLHKPQMIITSAVPNQPAIFTQKLEKQLGMEKEPEKRLILTTKPKLTVDDGPQQSHVAVAYVSHSAPTSVSVQKPLVVVTNYAQPPTSPAPSITSQNSSSPNSVVSSVSFTGAGSGSGTSGTASSGKTASTSKAKSRNVKAVVNPSKSPPVAKPQQKPQEDANTAQKIYAILEEYAVQLRNSPDMNNRPAPRRRSNPPTTTNTKRKKAVCKSKESFSDGDDTNFGEDGTEPLPSSEDSSSGVTVLQVCVSSSH